MQTTPTPDEFQELCLQVQALQDQVHDLLVRFQSFSRHRQFQRPIRPVALWAMKTMELPAVVSPMRKNAMQHSPAVKMQYPPVGRVRLIHGELGTQMVEAYDCNDRRIPSLCGPFEEVGPALLEIAGTKRWQEEFRSPAH